MNIIESIRKLAQEGRISYTGHAVNQMISRCISEATVESVLCATDNQIVEEQSSSKTPGKEHKDNRYLVYSPSNGDVVVVSLLLSHPAPEVRVVTAEHIDNTLWDRIEGGNPAIVRKTT